jgi:hypothetical protein
VLGEKSPDGDHLAVRRWVAFLLAEIAPVGEHLAIAHDDSAKRVVSACRLFESHAHEALVRFRRRRFDASPESACRNRHRHSAKRARYQVAAAHAGGQYLQAVLHALASNSFDRLIPRC